MADQRWWMVLDPYLLANDVIMTSLLFLTIIYVLVNFLIKSDALIMSHIIYFHSHQTTPILIAKFQNLIAKSKFNNLTSQ